MLCSATCNITRLLPKSISDSYTYVCYTGQFDRTHCENCSATIFCLCASRLDEVPRLMPTLSPASSASESAAFVPASRTIALSRLSLDLLLLKPALATPLLASVLVLLSGIPGSAVQAPLLLSAGLWRRCSAWKEGFATPTCEPSCSLPLAVLLDFLLAQLASSHLLRQCNHHLVKLFHWLHLLALAALQMVKGPATCQASRLHFFIHLLQLCTWVAVLDLVHLAFAAEVLDGATLQFALVRSLLFVLAPHAAAGLVGPDFLPLFIFEAVNVSDLLTLAAFGKGFPPFTIGGPINLFSTKGLEQ